MVRKEEEVGEGEKKKERSNSREEALAWESCRSQCGKDEGLAAAMERV